MRWFICALALLASAPRAFADDLDILRGALPVGPATFTRWSGFYLGGDVGYGDAAGDFSAATSALVSYDLRVTMLENEFNPSQWPVLGTAADRAVTFGGFVGYNTQWQDLILGIEGNYDQASFSLTAPDSPITRTTPADSGGNVYTVTIDGAGSIQDLNYGTLRARAGWVLGNFLPYAFAGFALGVADTSVSATVSGVEYTSGSVGTCTVAKPCIPFLYTSSSGRSSQVLYGFTAGVGLDYAITPNIFLRGEYEYVQFAPVSGVLVDINTARIGAGIKF